MSSVPPLAQFRNARLEKVRFLREELNINPFPTKSFRSHFAADVINGFDNLEGKEVTVAGRLMLWRRQGALSFGQLQDQTGRVQLYLRRDFVEEATGCIPYQNLNNLDTGDIVEATGPVVKTDRGEISVQAKTVRLLTKAIRPLPDKWAGLEDRETILRKRYLDITTSPEKRDFFANIGKMLFEIRSFLYERGFIELTTPIIQPQYGGGTAKPFMTHVNALDCDFYLAISHELYLKRLVAAGYDKVFTIGRYFRNEGIDKTHHPEFSMIETMTAYENYEYNMELVESMFRRIADNVFGKTQFRMGDHLIDFGPQWKRVKMADITQEVTGVDFRQITTLDDANATLKSLGVHEQAPNVGSALVLAFEEKVQPTLIQPTLVYHHPVEISPLAKPDPDDPRFAERFEIFIGGNEVGDNWSEQNDPVQLLERWKAFRPTGDDAGVSFPLDYDFIETLEYGIPPTTGIGPGIERMAMIFTEQENIDDVIFFPMMKPLLSSVNKALYQVEEKPGAQDIPGAAVFNLEEFQTLVKLGRLAPQTKSIHIRPHLRTWEPTKKQKDWIATGYIEVQGFFTNKPVSITAYTASGSAEFVTQTHVEALSQTSESLADYLKENLSDAKVNLADVAILESPA